MAVAMVMPNTTPVPMVLRAAAPEPLASINGTQPMMNANDVMRMGRRRNREPSTAASRIALPFFAFHLGELDDENGVLGRQPNEHDHADLGVDVQLEAARQHADHGAQDHGRGG
jgi:hypothetical protein